MRRDADARDRELVARFQAGDQRAFDELVAAHRAATARLVRRLLGGREDVDDVVQDVFVRVLEHLDGFRGESRFSTWLTTITLNCCRAYHRRRRLSLRHLFGFWKDRSREAAGGSDAAEMETHERIRQTVQRLPAKYREPVVLRYFEEWPIAEIAEVLGLSANTVEVRLSRARHKLKAMLEREIGGTCQ